MRLLLFITMVVLGAINHALAGAWLLPRDSRFESQGVLYSPSLKYGELGILEDESQKFAYSLQNSIRKIGYAYFIESGVDSDVNISAKLDLEQIADKIKLTTPLDELMLQKSYAKITSEFKLKTLLSQRGNHVHSMSFDLFPGQILFVDDTARHFEKTFAVGLSLNYGYSPSPYYYIDTSIGYRHYPDHSHNQIDFSALLGIKPTKRISILTGLYSTINGISVEERPFSRKLLRQRIDEFDLSDDNKTTLLDEINYSLKNVRAYHKHQITLKLGYAVKDDKAINLQAFTNVFKGKAFHCSTIAITYEVKV